MHTCELSHTKISVHCTDTDTDAAAAAAAACFQALPLRIETPGQIRRQIELEKRLKEIEDATRVFSRCAPFAWVLWKSERICSLLLLCAWGVWGMMCVAMLRP